MKIHKNQMIKRKIKIFAFFFVAAFVILFFTLKFTGSLDRHYSGAISFADAINQLPVVLLIAFCSAIILTIMTSKK